MKIFAKYNFRRQLIFKIAFFQLKSRQDAEDIVQEVFYRYIKTDKEFENAEHEKAWLIKVTLNACKKLWRSAWYRHRDEWPEQEISSDKNMEQDYLIQEKKEEILHAMWSLPRKYREVLHFFYFEDMSVKEIAKVTGIKESSVTCQLTRGRELLKKKLKEDYDYE